MLHAVLCTSATALQAWRVHLGYVGTRAAYEPAVVARLWQFTTGVAGLAWIGIDVLPAARLSAALRVTELAVACMDEV